MGPSVLVMLLLLVTGLLCSCYAKKAEDDNVITRRPCRHLVQESLQILTSLPCSDISAPDQQLLHKVHRYSQGRKQQKQVAEVVQKQQESKVEETQPHRAWLVEHF
ncbi:hypothetical protein ISCGN_015208 [Ixodes scapularis]